MSDEIQRVLYVAPRVHIYPIPPLKSNQGYKASEWNVDNERARIFTARIRIIETATQGKEEDEEEIVRTDVRLEDPNTGELFANCPYEVRRPSHVSFQGLVVLTGNAGSTLRRAGYRFVAILRRAGGGRSTEGVPGHWV